MPRVPTPPPKKGIRILNPIFSALSLWVVFLIIRLLSGKKVAFYGTLFIAFLPVHIYHGYLPYLEALSSLLGALTIYLFLKKRFLLSAVAFGLTGLSVLTWFGLIPMLAFLIFLQSRNLAQWLKKSALYFLIVLAIISPLWIRSIFLFGNPIYPYGVSILGGPQLPYSTAVHTQGFMIPGITSLYNFFVQAYLGLFGVPNGDPANLFFFDFPLLNLLLLGWFAATLLYFLPLLYGIIHSKIASPTYRALLILVLSFVVLTFIFSLIPGFGVHIRYLLPASAALGLFAGHGILSAEAFFRKRNIRWVFYLGIAGLCFGFAAAESVKTIAASYTWALYEDDFTWIRENTPTNALFIAPPDQCYPYYFNRAEVGVGNLPLTLSMLDVSYAWVNSEYRPSATRFSEEQLLTIMQKAKIVYNNTQTGTTIYKFNAQE